MKEIDMSSEAITRRLRQASELRDLSLSLMNAKLLTKEEAEALRAKRKMEQDQREDSSITQD